MTVIRWSRRQQSYDNSLDFVSHILVSNDGDPEGNSRRRRWRDGYEGDLVKLRLFPTIIKFRISGTN